jgi:hypothetical protein
VPAIYSSSVQSRCLPFTQAWSRCRRSRCHAFDLGGQREHPVLPPPAHPLQPEHHLADHPSPRLPPLPPLVTAFYQPTEHTPPTASSHLTRADLPALLIAAVDRQAAGSPASPGHQPPHLRPRRTAAREGSSPPGTQPRDPPPATARPPPGRPPRSGHTLPRAPSAPSSATHGRAAPATS